MIRLRTRSPRDPAVGDPGGFGVRRERLRAAQMLGALRERRLWDRRAETWDGEGSAGLVRVVAAVLEACEPASGCVAVDLGCGSGQVTIPLAGRCARVLGVDISPRSIDRLRAKCARDGITNLEVLAAPIETLQLAPGSVDLVVSNYAMHHLRDAEKARLLARALTWLVPGGRLVVGDMMFGRGVAGADREIVAGKLRSLLRRGPAGWWRVAKNLVRFGLRLREKPLARARWERLAVQAGYTDVRTVPVRAEAALLLARAPGAPSAGAPPVAAPLAVDPAPDSSPSPRPGVSRMGVPALLAGGIAICALAGCGTSSGRASAAGRTVVPPPTATRRSASATTTTTTTTRARVRPRPRGPLRPELLGLGTPGRRWRAVVRVRGRVAAWVAERDGVTMLRFDQHVVRLALHAGSTDPGPGHWRYGDAIVGRERSRLVAAFNSGFRLDTGAGGWRANGHTAVALTAGRASIVTYRSGRTDIGSWGREVPSRAPIASVRQNLEPLVDHGVAAPTVSDCIETCWGATIGGALSVARSALGVDAQGRLIDGAAASATPATLAQGLIDGGVIRAAELDINPDWVAAYLYRHTPGHLPAFVPVIPGQYGVYGHFLLPYSRDFFAVLAR